MNISSSPPIVPEYSTFGTLSRQAVGDKDDATTEQALPPIDEAPEEEKAENLPRDDEFRNEERKISSNHPQKSSEQKKLTLAAQHNDPHYQLEAIQNQWFEQDKGSSIDKLV